MGKPWYLLTDWAVSDAARAERIFRFYRWRWAVEEAFKFMKTFYGIEKVQMLAFEAVQRLVSYGWVAVGFLFHLGLTLPMRKCAYSLISAVGKPATIVHRSNKY